MFSTRLITVHVKWATSDLGSSAHLQMAPRCELKHSKDRLSTADHHNFNICRIRNLLEMIRRSASQGMMTERADLSSRTFDNLALIGVDSCEAT